MTGLNGSLASQSILHPCTDKTLHKTMYSTNIGVFDLTDVDLWDPTSVQQYCNVQSLITATFVVSLLQPAMFVIALFLVLVGSMELLSVWRTRSRGLQQLFGLCITYAEGAQCWLIKIRLLLLTACSAHGTCQWASLFPRGVSRSQH